jgi:23S rRNA pseudouridine2605 synthase
MRGYRRADTGRRALSRKSLDRVLSKAGLGSRTDARGWIAAGRVAVNGQVARDPECRVDTGRDRVWLDGKPLVARDRVYLVLHKPTGYVTTSRDPEGRPTVYDLVKDVKTFVSPVGRLDRDTSGLLLMTNDSQFAERVTNPASHVPKTYRVAASALLSDADLQLLRNGVTLRDGPTRPALVRRLHDTSRRTWFEITLTEGRNRQVRRMVEALGARAMRLARVAIGPLALADLPAGSWRHLTRAEVRRLSNQ